MVLSNSSQLYLESDTSLFISGDFVSSSSRLFSSAGSLVTATGCLNLTDSHLLINSTTSGQVQFTSLGPGCKMQGFSTVGWNDPSDECLSKVEQLSVHSR